MSGVVACHKVYDRTGTSHCFVDSFNSCSLSFVFIFYLNKTGPELQVIFFSNGKSIYFKKGQRQTIGEGVRAIMGGALILQLKVDTSGV